MGHFFRGLANSELNNHDDALLNYDEARKYAPRHPDTYGNRGTSKLALQRYQDAIDDLDEAIRLKPNFPEAFSSRGFAKLSLNRPHEAIGDLDEAIRLEPDNVENYLVRGNAKLALQLYQDAIADFDEVIKRDSNFAEAHLFRAIAKNSLKRHQDAIVDFDEAIRKEKNFPLAFQLRGKTKIILKQYDEAISDLTQAIELDNTFTEAYIDRGRAKGALGRHQDAIADFDEVIRLKSNEGRGFYFRGVAKGALELHKEAIADLDEAIRLKIDYAEAFHFRGLTNFMLEHYQEATIDFDRAIALIEKDIKSDPTNEDTLKTRLSAERHKTITVMKLEQEKELTEYRKSVQKYSPTGLAESYNSQIVELEKQLFGKEIGTNTNSQNKEGVEQKWYLCPISIVIMIAIAVIALISVLHQYRICQNSIFVYCDVIQLFLSPLFWIFVTLVLMASSKANVSKFGLVSASRLIARRLRVYVMLIWLFVTDFYFAITGLFAPIFNETDGTLTLMRYGATLLLLTSPFLIYYRHLSKGGERIACYMAFDDSRTKQTLILDASD